MSEHIKKRRKELHLKQSELAKLLGVCEDTITGWENERCLPHMRHYSKLIQFFGYNPFLVDATTLGGRIKKYRLEHAISQNKLAIMLEVDETTVRSWEKNTHVPSRRKLTLLENIINEKELQ